MCNRDNSPEEAVIERAWLAGSVDQAAQLLRPPADDVFVATLLS